MSTPCLASRVLLKFEGSTYSGSFQTIELHPAPILVQSTRVINTQCNGPNRIKFDRHQFIIFYYLTSPSTHSEFGIQEPEFCDPSQASVTCNMKKSKYVFKFLGRKARGRLLATVWHSKVGNFPKEISPPLQLLKRQHVLNIFPHFICNFMFLISLNIFSLLQQLW